MGRGRDAEYRGGMPTERPQNALEAVVWRRLPISAWPWRSAGYLLTTLPLALAAFAVLAVPWLVLAAGDHRVDEAAVLIVVGIALIATVGPLIASPLAKVELRRLRMVDRRPIEPAHRRAAAGLRSRYTDPATWREVGYVCLLATATPVLTLAALLTALLAGAFVASPLLVIAQGPGNEPVALAFGSVATTSETVPYVVAGVAMSVLLPYLVTLLAGAHAAMARALLTGGRSEQLRAELVEVSRSRTRLVDAFEAERRRIERDLHDGAQQRLVSLTLKLGLARLDLPADSPATVTVAEAHEQAKQLMAELRELIHGIQPQILTDLGLAAAIEELADQSPIPVAVDARLPTRIPGQIENTTYFVVSEALANVAKHSGATSATVTAHLSDEVLTVQISDNGHGGADPNHGTGLTGLADRVAVTDGRMLLSSPAGGPTVLRVEVPCVQSQPVSE